MAGPALSRCGCIGPRAMLVEQLYISARYSFRTRIIERLVISLFANIYLV